MYHFLKEHPTETIILRIRNGEHSKDFLETIKTYLAPDSRRGDRIARHLYSRHAKDGTVPTLGELRGKVLILQDFKTSPAGLYGLPWGPDTISNYDHEIAPGTHFLVRKWNGVKSHLSKAPQPGSNKLRITHTTASTGVHPIDIAARNSPHVGMNNLLGQYLKDNEGGCFGIVVMDFPGKLLVDLIVKLNKYQAPELPSLHFDSTDTYTASEDARET
ncbi:1-phosphatidylinositol phosphodiesterase [Ceratocystis platani]|uniref:1-phosphatidylinositol phosphodiesterase n=2 Tax=Ceratocystis TaxID=5157 RepID=A0A0F8B501_CERFI|nr:1-phosphatidylinositol phosphodiesterase [Ceratocystis platani]